MSETNIIIAEEVVKSSLPASFGGEIATVLASEMGRENKVHTVSSTDDFDKIFGKNNNDSYKLLRYLLGRGNVLKVVRTPVKLSTAESEAELQLAKASATFYKNGGVSGDGMVVTAVANGTAYNGDANGAGIGIVISYQGAGLFSITVQRGVKHSTTNPDPEVIEFFPVVSLYPESIYYYPFVVKSEIIDISVTANASFDEDDSLFASGNADIEKALAGGVGSVIADVQADMVAVAPLLGSRDEPFATFIIPDKAASFVKAVSDAIYAEKKDFVTLIYAGSQGTTPSNPYTTGEVSYVAAYYPKVWIPSLGFVDPVVAVADRIAANHKNGTFFKALANLEGGVLTDVIDVEKSFSEEDINKLQAAHINPIIVRSGVGCVLWGQDTCSTSRADIDRMSVRLLVNYLKRVVYSISLDYMFADNNSFTWNQWIDRVTPYVRDIANVNGIANYKVICDETIISAQDIAAGIMRGYVIIQPYNQITKIIIKFTVDETGVSFE